MPWWHDEDGEASLRPNAKNLLKRTNMGQNLEAQLAQVAERRDTERLIWQVLKQQRLAGGAAQPAPAQLPAPALLPIGPPTVLMGQRPAVRMMRRDVQAAHPDLAQIEFATRLYLHLAQSPQNDENVHLRDMPSLASEALDLRPGVHVLRWLASEPGVWRGGAYIHAKFSPKQVDGEWRLVRSRELPVFVAVKRRGIVWYGELILCFSAAYRPGASRSNDAPLCLVRWLQPIAVVARVERRNLTAEEEAGPFEVYRWATHTGSYMIGHPRHSTPQYGVVDAGQVRYRAPIFVGPSEAREEPNPLFRLVTDMCGRF